MSTTPPGPYSKVDDLDITADYPPAAPTDTWVKPQRAKAGVAEDPLRAYQEELKALRQSVAAVTTSRDRLQADLTALSAKREELERQLQSKDAQHADRARDLDVRQQEMATLRRDLTAAVTSRDQLQSELAATAAKLQELEQQSEAGGDQSARQAWALGERDRQITELTEQLTKRAEQHFLISAERDDLQARLERARADIASAAQKRKASAVAEEEREHARRDAALTRNLEDLTELQRRVLKLREALQRAESRRQVFETMLREREELIDQREARVRELQADLGNQRRDHSAALERANAQLAAALAREGGAARIIAEPPLVPVSQPAASVAVADVESQQRIAGLEAELAQVQEALTRSQEQLLAEQEANLTLRADLGAAELQLRTAENDLQQNHARLEATHAQTGAQLPSERARQRLLVRTEGDAGIVHVLGKRTTIGRIPANDLCIDADAVSRHHAVVLVTDHGTVVEDLNSTNGVFVNDVRVVRHELRDGDVLTIGKTSFRYVLKPEVVQA